ncbi:MAG TPA: STAS domain-containing protein, partial [Streptosporangiaceae bacterium]|nr:STAS domain-containing protein [Streptosporangiaceae bacterium]
MDDSRHTAEPVIVRLPAEFDMSNAGYVAKQLREAITPGVGTVVADMTTTDLCDSSGVRIVILARDWAASDDAELRLAVPPGHVLDILKLLGLDQLLPIYPSVDEALER